MIRDTFEMPPRLYLQARLCTIIGWGIGLADVKMRASGDTTTFSFLLLITTLIFKKRFLNFYL